MTDILTTADIFLTWRDRINTLITQLGDSTTLTTTFKDNLVGAINELDGEIDDISTLTTTFKDHLVGAINELDAGQGDLGNLTTTANTELVLAVNEVNGKAGTLSALTTTIKTSLVAAINELDAELGDLDNLETTDKSTIVASINEIVTSKLQLANKQLNAGRAATDTLDSLTVSTFSAPTTVNSYNSSVVAQYGTGKFENDNSTNGGAGGALQTEIIDFLTDINRTETRYGTEYYLTQIEAGNGVDVDNQVNDGGDIYNAMVTNGNQYLGQIGDIITWVGWVKYITLADVGLQDIIIGNDSNVTTWIDDVLVGGSGFSKISAVGTWFHVRQQITLTKEYETVFPAIYGNFGTTSGEIIGIGMSALFKGDIKITKAQHIGLFG